MSAQKNFVNYHVLISHSPSCLNRDDQNMQKRAVFGGVERLRISSQSLKRAMRRPPENGPNYWIDCGVLGSPSIRSRSIDDITRAFTGKLSAEFDDDTVIRQAVEMFATGKKATDNEDGADNSGGEATETGTKIAVAPWSLEEMRLICKSIAQIKQNGLTEDEKSKALKKVGKEVGKKGNKRKLTEEDCLNEAMTKRIVKKIEGAEQKLRAAAGSAVDIALWGRMATTGLMTSIDGALAVAHAITTHQAQPDTDWFTAVDDLVEDAGDTGAGHLDTQEFSSGVFYRYASLNIKQLQANLGDVPRDRALEVARHVFHMLWSVVPTAKQQSYAAHNLADYAIVTFDDLPVSLANAFETPVINHSGGGYLQPSIDALNAYFRRTRDVHGLSKIAAAAPGLQESCKDCPTVFTSLGGLESWIQDDAQAKE